MKDFEEGVEILFHDSFVKGINSICAKEIGEKCKLCNKEDLRHRKSYAWPVYDYDSNEVKIFMFAVNNSTPVPALISMYETYGTVTDRDYIIERKGEGTSTTYTLVPMDKAKFRSKDNVKVPTEKAIVSLAAKAFPPNGTGKDEEEDDEQVDYSEMTAKELYKLCEDREIECEPKEKAKYYIKLLEEHDEENVKDDDDDDDNDSDDDEDDEW